ncbi:MAG: hypothetical protein SPI65_03065 [Peptoniphilus sp.]|nr:hypothetical protein [Peptoniphilus sp.]MDD7362764.1 hypothetical protein [Bacillota bacterium]MDY6044542.1 hypothetical protein [Peptoniphilus sp.]
MALYLSDPYRKTMEITIPDTVKSKGYHYFLLEDSIVAPPVEHYTKGDAAFIDNQPVDYTVIEDGHLQCKVENIESGAKKELTIDWPRRLQHMQDNIARILLTAAVDKLLHVDVLDASTEEECYILVDTEDIGFVSLEKIENFVNHLIESNLPIQEHADSVEIAGIDESKSVGPVLKQTGELALFAIKKVEKIEQGLKLSFAAGRAALDDYRNHRYLTKNLSMYLQASTTKDIWRAVKKLQGKIDGQKKTIDELEAKLGLEQVQEFMSRRRTIQGVGYIYLTLENINFKNFKNLTQAIQKKAKTVQIYGIPNGNEAQIHVIRSADVNVDLKKILDSLDDEHLDGTGNLYRVQANVPRGNMTRVMETFLFKIQRELADEKKND